MKKKPKVLILLPANYSLHEIITYNLYKLGYDAIVLHNESFIFKYKSFAQRLKNFFIKTFKCDKTFKHRLREEFMFEKMKDVIDSVEHYDHILVIRADFFSHRLLDYLKSKTQDFISYHFDGIDRYPDIFDRITKFDRFYVFDKDNIEKYPQYHFLPATNFYFDYIPLENKSPKNNPDFYFLSSYHPSRTEALIAFDDFAKKNNLTTHFEIIYSSNNTPPALLSKRFDCHTKYIGFMEYLNKIQHSTYILDLLISEHQGLSFRVFESIKWKKKLVTTNPTVRNYDFYHPNNIFILENNYEHLLEFLALPYQELDAKIVEKYSMSNWLKYIFKQPHHQIISLP